MKHYILINKKIAVKALTNLVKKQKEVESLNVFKKMCFVNSFSFRPASVEAIGWYGGNNQEDAIKILAIVPSEVSWYKGKGMVFTEVDPKATEEDNYHCLPFNNPKEAQGIIEILENKKYNNIYLVINYKSGQLNTSSNTSINLSQEDINKPDEGLVGLFRSQEEEKKKLENIIAEQQDKLNAIQKYCEEQEVKFKKDLDDLKNVLLKDKEQVITQMQHEIDIRREAIDARQVEINRLNVCLQNEQNEVSRQKGLVIENEKKANFYDTELKAERLKVSDLQNQLNNITLDRNNWQSQFMGEQVKVNNLQNQVNNLTNERNNWESSFKQEEKRSAVYYNEANDLKNKLNQHPRYGSVTNTDSKSKFGTGITYIWLKNYSGKLTIQVRTQLVRNDVGWESIQYYCTVDKSEPEANW